MARPSSSYRAARRNDWRRQHLIWRAGSNLMQLGVITNVHNSYPAAGSQLLKVLQTRRRPHAR
jgi:hypothetical protein